MKKTILMSVLLSVGFLCNEANAFGALQLSVKELGSIRALARRIGNAKQQELQKQEQQQKHFSALQAKIKGHKAQYLQKAKALHQAYQKAIKPVLDEYKAKGLTINPSWTKLGHSM